MITPVKSIKERLQKRRFLKKNFRTELLCFAGKCRSNSTHRSIILFTTHKAASLYMNQIMRRLTTSAGMVPVDFLRYFSEGGGNRKREISTMYMEQGYFYGVYRAFTKSIPNLKQYLIVLMLRDPRDQLVSLYFSQAYSHGTPQYNIQMKQTILERRQEAVQMTIDEFVLKHSPMFLARYQEYVKNCLHQPNVLYLKYEDMVSDFEGWMRKLLVFLQLDVPQEVIHQIIAEADFSVPKENIYAHKRQVTPGDYKRKLQPETISELNRIFGDVLRTLDYAVG